jgi:geranylgeranyl diphosphate synthase type I
MLSSYGLPLGDAFQLRDDMLGAFGEEQTVGKPVGGDFKEGKPTPMLARAYEKASPAQRRVLDTVGSMDLSNDDIAAIQQILEETGTRQEMEDIIQSLASTAVDALVKDQLAGNSYDALVALADAVTQRSV